MVTLQEELWFDRDAFVVPWCIDYIPLDENFFLSVTTF
jgi:hypothetical protein